MRTQRLTAYALVIGLTCLSAGSVLAQYPNGSPLPPLKGHYQISLNGTCILASPPGFTAFPDLQPSPGAYSEVDQFYETGSITFDGVGQAISTHKGISIATVAPAFNAPPYVVTYDQICRFGYVMKSISSFTLQNGSCSGTNTTGPTAFGVPGSTVKTTGLTYDGQIGALGSVLTYGATMPSQSTLEVSNGFNVKQLCGTLVTAVRTIQ